MNCVVYTSGQIFCNSIKFITRLNLLYLTGWWVATPLAVRFAPQTIRTNYTISRAAPIVDLRVAIVGSAIWTPILDSRRSIARTSSWNRHELFQRNGCRSDQFNQCRLLLMLYKLYWKKSSETMQLIFELCVTNASTKIKTICPTFLFTCQHYNYKLIRAFLW